LSSDPRCVNWKCDFMHSPRSTSTMLIPWSRYVLSTTPPSRREGYPELTGMCMRYDYIIPVAHDKGTHIGWIASGHSFIKAPATAADEMPDPRPTAARAYCCSSSVSVSQSSGSAYSPEVNLLVLAVFFFCRLNMSTFAPVPILILHWYDGRTSTTLSSLLVVFFIVPKLPIYFHG
jgi:hypothetical protein